jgi:endonuclease/exonuclease/phosphatase family metal-dependent hydrolase
MKTRKLTLLLILAAFATLCSCRPRNVTSRVLVAFYNCENFFDTIHNPSFYDTEFTPAGKYHYTQKIYEQKLRNIATVIQSIGENAQIAVMGLAEVENDTVLKDLVAQPEIASFHYRYIWYSGHDERGINVAMIYNTGYFKPLKSESLHVILDSVKPVVEGSKMNTRDILYVCGILAGDTVNIFVNHWPSRTDGDSESRPKRFVAAGVLKECISKLRITDSLAKIIVMGDFNDNPDDSSIINVLEASASGNNCLFNPFMAAYKKGEGTERFKHNWNLFDQVMVSGGMLADATNHICYDSAGVYKPDFLTDHHKGNEGEPFRSWLGNFWLNGYSDHFPVLLYLKKVGG